MNTRRQLFLITVIAGCLFTSAITALGDGSDTPTTQPATAPAIASTQSAVEGNIQKLIDQLNADDWRSRQSAEDRLVALGEVARSAVIRINSTGSAEQRTRASSILSRLEIAIANSPTLITLHMKDANPRDVFAAISAQAGMEIALFPENLWAKQRGVQFAPVTVDIDRQPFWDAIAQVGRLTNSRIDMMNAGDGPKLTARQCNPGEDWLAGPRSESGQFIVQPIEISRNQTVTFSPAPSKESSSDLRIRLLVDPKVTVMRVMYRPKLTEALDDKGNSLVPPDEISQGFQEGPGLTFELSTPLAFPSDGFSKLTSLRGKIGVAVASHVEHLNVPDVMAALNKVNTVGGWTLTLKSFHVEDHNGSMALSAKVPSQNVDPNTVYSLLNQIRLVDADNHTFSGGNGGSGDGIHYEVTRNFSSPNVIRPPVSLKWDFPTAVEEKQVSFQFNDLPLPIP